MAYAKTYKRNYQAIDNSNDIIFDIGKRKQVTVRKFNNINLVDIREYYIDKATGENRPGKKGISLTEESWNLLLENQNKIQSALDKLAGRTTSGSGLAGKLQAIPVTADSKDLPPVKKPKTKTERKKEVVSSEFVADSDESAGDAQGLALPALKSASEEPKKPKKEKTKKKPEPESDSELDDDIDDLVKELESEED